MAEDEVVHYFFGDREREKENEKGKVFTAMIILYYL